MQKVLKNSTVIFYCKEGENLKLKKSAYQKLYLVKLKNHTSNFLKDFKKRYSLFPWSQVSKIGKSKLRSVIPVVVGSKEYSIKELVDILNKTKTSLRDKQKIGYYNNIFNGFKKATNGKMSIEVKEIYKQSKEELDKEFRIMKEELRFSLQALKEINKALKSNKITTESEESVMNTFEEDYTSESEEISDVEFLSMLVEAESDLLFDDEEEFEEGANIDNTKIFVKLLKDVKPVFKSCKKAIKNEDYDKAKEKLKELKEYTSKAAKEVDNIKGDEWSAFAGIVLKFLKYFAIGLASMAPSTIYVGVKGWRAAGNVTAALAIGGKAVRGAADVKGTLNSITGIADSIKKEKNITADTFNPVKQKIVRSIKALDRQIETLERKVEKAEKLRNTERENRRKRDRIAKESVEFEKAKLAIYRACENGEITLEEREDLLVELRNEHFVVEAEAEVMNDGYLSNHETFEKVKAVLYEKCGNGEISVEEREDLIAKAYDRIMSEGGAGCDTSSMGSASPKEQMEKNKMSAKEADTQTKDFNKEAGNVEKEINNQASDIMKSTSL